MKFSQEQLFVSYRIVSYCRSIAERDWPLKNSILCTWTRCLECQKDVTLPEIQKKNALTEERIVDSFCKRCNNVDTWVGTLKLNSHGCSACHRIFDRSEWPRQMLKDHLRHNIKLICSACRADGFTTYDTDGRTCKFCKKKRGAGKFDKLFVS